MNYKLNYMYVLYCKSVVCFVQLATILVECSIQLNVLCRCVRLV